jgi:hypothetical protein
LALRSSSARTPLSAVTTLIGLAIAPSPDAAASGII